MRVYAAAPLRTRPTLIRWRTHADAKVMSYFILAFTNVLYSFKVALGYFFHKWIGKINSSDF